jgi:hypothetical protein
MQMTIVDDGRPTDVDVRVVDGRILLSAGAVETALGWEITDEGLCREGLCVPCPDGWDPRAGVHLDALADHLGRPVSIDVAEGVAWMGVGSDERARALRSLQAPDFALRDLRGQTHRLATHRGRKVLLLAWASW